MREIKFRAWNTMTGHMWDLQRMNFKNGQLLYEGSNMPTSKDNTSNHIVMQYTGLKDKNSKEIYEGDIAKLFNLSDEAIKEVVFENGAFGYTSNFGFISFVSNTHFKWQNGKSEKIEIIGNIYENPKLMEEHS